MANNRVKDIVIKLLGKAGITVNGNNPWDLQIHNENFYQRIIRDPALGAGESYMDGWWDCEAMDQMLDRLLRVDFSSLYKNNPRLVWSAFQSKLFNRQKANQAFKVGETHYDVGNDLYIAMLDKRLVYTCGYWRKAGDLDQAQEAKLDLVCKKIGLKPEMSVLELGCGFGSFARFAAEKYGVSVTGYTVSKQQAKLGKQLCRDLPVEIRLDDYRNANGKYDRVISIGIMEHVGYKNYRSYMELVSKTLKEDGIAFFHTIGSNYSKTSANAWTDKYIFPNGMIPSITQLGKAMENLFVMEDWHNFGEDYDKTLMAWFHNFKNAWPELKDDYDERFYRMWTFYLLSSAASFRCRDLQLWQVVMTKTGRPQPDCRIS